MAVFKFFLVIFFCFTKAQFYNVNLTERIQFLRDFLHREGRPSTIISHLPLSQNEHVQLCRAVSAEHRQFKIASEEEYTRAEGTDNAVHLVDLQNESAWALLNKVVKDESIKSPSRWLLFVNDDRENGLSSGANTDYKRDIDGRFNELYIDISTEVYVAFQWKNYVKLCAVYKIKAHLPLQWEELGEWTALGFDRPRPAPAAARRHDLGGVDVVVAAVILRDRSLADMPDYLHREVDTLSKIPYYMTNHLVEWVNGTKVLNRTSSWGYRQPDGRYDGIVREIQDGRADIAGSVMITTKERLEYLNFIVPPAQIEALFVFKKPSLASVTNIYVLPFSIGVWLSIVVLIIISTSTLFLSYFREDDIKGHRKMSWFPKISDGFFDTLCLVFQQGTATDPISIAKSNSTRGSESENPKIPNSEKKVKVHRKVQMPLNAFWPKGT